MEGTNTLIQFLNELINIVTRIFHLSGTIPEMVIWSYAILQLALQCGV